MKVEKIYEDDFCLIVNKCPFLISKGFDDKKDQKTVETIFGLKCVHRLDKDTTGCLILSKKEIFTEKIKELFKKRKIKKEYQAIVHGNIVENGKIDSPIIRRRNKKNLFRVSGSKQSKNAITYFKKIKSIENKFGIFSHIRIRIITGRTHQIRVHLSSIKFPVAYDKDYGKKDLTFNPKSRQLLHASKIEFFHPNLKIKIKAKAKLPDDFVSFLDLEN